MFDAGTNFVLEKFRHFCRSINVEQAVSLAYHHQSNGQVKACIKFIKQTFKKCTESGRDKNIALLQVHTMSIDQGLPDPVTIMFNRLVQGIMPVVDQKPLGQDHDDDHHIKLVEIQRKNDNDTLPVFSNVAIGSAVAVQHEDGCPWTHGMVGWQGQPQSPWQIICYPTYKQWQMHFKKQMPHKTHYSNSRYISTAPI